MNKYTTMTFALEDLKKRGYTDDFVLNEENSMKNSRSNTTYKPSDMQIVEYHRFEGESDPGDMAIVFAVKCKDGAKGLILSSYGTYTDTAMVSFMDEVKIMDSEGNKDIVKPEPLKNFV